MFVCNPAIHVLLELAVAVIKLVAVDAALVKLLLEADNALVMLRLQIPDVAVVEFLTLLRFALLKLLFLTELTTLVLFAALFKFTATIALVGATIIVAAIRHVALVISERRSVIAGHAVYWFLVGWVYRDRRRRRVRLHAVRAVIALVVLGITAGRR